MFDKKFENSLEKELEKPLEEEFKKKLEEEFENQLKNQFENQFENAFEKKTILEDAAKKLCFLLWALNAFPESRKKILKVINRRFKEIYNDNPDDHPRPERDESFEKAVGISSVDAIMLEEIDITDNDTSFNNNNTSFNNNNTSFNDTSYDDNDSSFRSEDISYYSEDEDENTTGDISLDSFDIKQNDIAYDEGKKFNSKPVLSKSTNKDSFDFERLVKDAIFAEMGQRVTRGLLKKILTKTAVNDSEVMEENETITEFTSEVETIEKEKIKVRSTKDKHKELLQEKSYWENKSEKTRLNRISNENNHNLAQRINFFFNRYDQKLPYQAYSAGVTLDEWRSLMQKAKQEKKYISEPEALDSSPVARI